MALITNSEEYEAIVSPEVLREAAGNLRLKFPESAVVRFYTLLGELRPTLIDPGQASKDIDLPNSIAPKDQHVLDGCLIAGASICLTLDRRHLLTDELRQWGMRRNLRFLTPGEFLVWDRLRSE